MDAPPLLANFFSQLISNWGLAAALAALCFLALRGNWARQRRSAEVTAEPDSIRQACAPKTRAAASFEAPSDFLRWQVEMHETARDVKAEIDTKLLALQSLMVLANEHCQRLEVMLAKAEKPGAKNAPPLVTGREILSRIENASGELPPLDARALGKELLTPAQAKLARQLVSEHEYSPADIARYIGASVVDVELFLAIHAA